MRRADLFHRFIQRRVPGADPSPIDPRPIDEAIAISINPIAAPIVAPANRIFMHFLLRY
jgi:hypothetical protein